MALTAVAAMSMNTAGVAAGTEFEGHTVGAGKLRGIQWIVEAIPDEGRKGICFGVGYEKFTQPFEVRCSAPAERRGIVTSVESEHRHSRHGAITVVGMAMNQAVDRVKVMTCDHQVEVWRPKSPRGPGSRLGHIADYRYVAFAIRGPWCVTAITTYGRAGDTLFEGSSYEI